MEKVNYFYFLMLFSLLGMAQTNNRIVICHRPASMPDNPQTISINESDWEMYEAQGASKGPCRGNSEWDNDEGNIPQSMPQGDGNVIDPQPFIKAKCNPEEDNKIGIKCGNIEEIKLPYSEFSLSRSSESDNSPQEYLVGTGKQIISIDENGKYMSADGEGYSQYVDLATEPGLSDLFVRVVTITHPKTLKKVIFALFDTSSVSQMIRENLVGKIRTELDPNFDESNLVLLATHTHTGGSGLGCYAGVAAANGGFAPENVETYGLNAFRAIKQAFANEKSMNIAYVEYTVPDESPLLYARSSWEAYNRNPEVIKNGKQIDATTRHKIGDRKMQLLLFLREGKLHSIIDFFGTHPNWTYIKQKHSQSDDIETHTMNSDTRSFASQLLEDQLPEDGVVLYPQRGAADIDLLGYGASQNLPKLINHPNAKYYFNQYTISDFFDYKDPNDPNVMSDYFTHLNNVLPNEELLAKEFNTYTYEEAARYSKLLAYETINAISRAEELEYISGDFDSELVYVDMPSQELPTDRGNYAKTLNPLDYYTETQVKVPFFSMIETIGSTFEDTLLFYIPKEFRPSTIVSKMMDFTFGNAVRFLIPSSNVARTGEPIIGANALISDISVLSDGSNPGTAFLYPLLSTFIRMPEELHYAFSFFTLDRKYTRNIISHGDEKLKLLWGGKKGYNGIAFMSSQVPKSATLFASVFIPVSPTAAQQLIWIKDGFYKDIPSTLPRIIPLQAIKFGDNIMFATGPGEFSHTLSRRIENTMMAVMKDKMKRSIFIDYANDYANYWHTPEEYSAQADFILIGKERHHNRGVPQQLGFNIFGKWQGPVIQYNYEKLMKAMLKPKQSLDRKYALERDFVPAFDGHLTDPTWYNKLSDIGRNPLLKEGGGVGDPGAYVVEILKGLALTPIGLVEQTVGTIFQGPFNIVFGMYDILMKPVMEKVEEL